MNNVYIVVDNSPVMRQPFSNVPPISGLSQPTPPSSFWNAVRFKTSPFVSLTSFKGFKVLCVYNLLLLLGK